MRNGGPHRTIPLTSLLDMRVVQVQAARLVADLARGTDAFGYHEPGTMGGKWIRMGCRAPTTPATGIANTNGSRTANG